MSEEEKPVKWYDDIGKVIRYTVWVLFGWLAISTFWGVLVACYGTGNPTWSPNLLGDSFGVVNAILTAAAFIAVVMTYRKEQEQLAILKEEQQVRIEESKSRDIDERKKTLHSLFTTALQMHVEKRTNLLSSIFGMHDEDRADAASAEEVIANSDTYFAQLETWCEIALEFMSPFGQFDRYVYCNILGSSLLPFEYKALRMILDSSDPRKPMIEHLAMYLEIWEPEDGHERRDNQTTPVAL